MDSLLAWRDMDCLFYTESLTLTNQSLLQTVLYVKNVTIHMELLWKGTTNPAAERTANWYHEINREMRPE
jgi:hypothetical protein